MESELVDAENRISLTMTLRNLCVKQKPSARTFFMPEPNSHFFWPNGRHNRVTVTAQEKLYSSQKFLNVLHFPTLFAFEIMWWRNVFEWRSTPCALKPSAPINIITPTHHRCTIQGLLLVCRFKTRALHPATIWLSKSIMSWLYLLMNRAIQCRRDVSCMFEELGVWKTKITTYHSSGKGVGKMSLSSARRKGEAESRPNTSASTPILCSCTVRMYSLRTSFTLPLSKKGVRINHAYVATKRRKKKRKQRIRRCATNNIKNRRAEKEDKAYHRPLVLIRSDRSLARSACFFTLLQHICVQVYVSWSIKI